MTFSVVARVPGTGLLGAASASFSLAVGRAVPAVVPGVGAVVSQAWTNPALRGAVLDRLAGGQSADEVAAALPGLDEGIDLRQVVAIGTSGPALAWTGGRCTAPAGHRVADGVAVAGNLLASDEVLDEVLASVLVGLGAVEGPDGLARLLSGGLAAGQRLGGDVRGQQSAVVLVGEGPRGGLVADLAVDLRVDDDTAAVARLVDLAAQSRPPLRPRTG